MGSAFEDSGRFVRFAVSRLPSLLTNVPKPRQYWYDMKRYIYDEGFRELSDAFRQLKLPAADGRSPPHATPLQGQC
jgi:hypothetical protein